MASAAAQIVAGPSVTTRAKHRLPLGTLNQSSKSRKTSKRHGPSRFKVYADQPEAAAEGCEAAAAAAIAQPDGAVGAVVVDGVVDAEALPPGVIDLHQRHSGDPFLVADYADEIYHYLRTREEALAVDPDFLKKQSKITAKNLAVLNDWLVQVHYKFELQIETLYITNAILLRYLSRVDIPRNRLQLFGVTAMLLASKYEDMYPPVVRDFAYITANAYSAKQIIAAEIDMLKELEFSLEQPLPLHFLERYVQVTGVDPVTHEIAKYLLELCLVHGSMIRFLPSQQALAALSFAHTIKDKKSIWDPSVEFYSGFTQEDIAPVERAMAEILRQSKVSDLQAVPKKYKRGDYFGIANRSDVARYVIEP